MESGQRPPSEDEDDRRLKACRLKKTTAEGWQRPPMKGNRRSPMKGGSDHTESPIWGFGAEGFGIGGFWSRKRPDFEC